MPAQTIPVVDQRNRLFHDLKVSLDWEAARMRPASALLSDQEIVRLIRIFVDLGVRRVQFDGMGPGESRDLTVFSTDLASIPGLEIVPIASCPALDAKTPAFLCDRCTRAALSANGVLTTCEVAPRGWDLRTPLRLGWDNWAIAALVRRVWQGRSDRYSDGPRLGSGKSRQAARPGSSTGRDH